MNTNIENDWTKLLDGTKSGDKQRQTQFYHKLTVTLLPIAQSRLRGWSSAIHQDVLQETLITVSRKLDSIQSQPHHFAAGILRNKIGDVLRTEKKRKTVSLDLHADTDEFTIQRDIERALSDASSAKDPLQQLETKDQLERIVWAIQHLSAFCHQFFTGILEHQEISEIWENARIAEPDLKNSTFRKRIFDCRMRLKQILQEG
ncbi:hypothetical protein KJ564_14655 [bacterium]|nr:hypothetical protein [bacterium]MBU1881912.1 hypothetical protein [bacterium]